jgi:DNA-directed RNA polymerase beta subunit
MTDWGTFIINGTERVVVTQLVRSPGAYVMEPKDREKQVFIANLMPARGSWLELEIDKKGRVYVRIDRKRSCRSASSCAPWATCCARGRSRSARPASPRE